MHKELQEKSKKIAVIGLGYVGLPIALAFAKKFSVIGFDINEERVSLMRQGIDPSNEIHPTAFEQSDIYFTADESALKNAHFFIVAVPTDVDEHKVPNLKPLIKASISVGKALKPGDYVVYESTVYPGCTEEDCLPILEKTSGLKCEINNNKSVLIHAMDENLEQEATFKLGYSPERIVPGDKVRTLTSIMKVVSGSDEESLDVIAKVYHDIIEAGVYKAPSIKVAEAAKVIENTQRDLNISLMNELSMIFDKMNIDTQEVLKAASTKWNFLKFYPGLVGGHCIGVDPYYLLYKSKELGYDPQVILSGRRVNDEMSAFVAKKLIQFLTQIGKNPAQSKVLVMGVTFKENVSDIRNSKVIDLIHELMDFSVDVHITDPYASPTELAHDYQLPLIEQLDNDYDAIILAVAHDEYRNYSMSEITTLMNKNPILFDLKGIIEGDKNEVLYWRL